MFAALCWAGEASGSGLAGNEGVQRMVAVTWRAALVSAAAALAGAMIIASHRETVIAGPIIALALIPAAAAVGAATAGLQPGLLWGALRRLGVDMALVMVLTGLFVGRKQASVRRRPLL